MLQGIPILHILFSFYYCTTVVMATDVTKTLFRLQFLVLHFTCWPRCYIPSPKGCLSHSCIKRYSGCLATVNAASAWQPCRPLPPSSIKFGRDKVSYPLSLSLSPSRAILRSGVLQHSPWLIVEVPAIMYSCQGSWQTLRLH